MNRTAQSVRRTAVHVFAATFAMGALALASTSAHAESQGSGFRPAGPLTTVSATTSSSADWAATVDADARAMDALGIAEPMNTNVHTSRAWTTDSSGRSTYTFRRGQRVNFKFSAYNASSRSRSVHVVIQVYRRIFCIMSPCPNNQQVLFNGYTTFGPGTSTKYLPMVVGYSDPTGEWEYNVTIDEDGRYGDNDESAYASFAIAR